jgi:hypothetical protein
MTFKTRNQPLKPIPSFNFVNRREIDYILASLQLMAESGQVDPMEQEDFTNLLDSFQIFALSV